VNFGSILRLVVRRSLGNWRLLINVAVGVNIATTLLDSTAIYCDAISDLGLTYDLRHHDRNKRDVQIHLGSLVTRRHDNDVRNTIVANSVHNTVGPFLRATSENGKSATFFLSEVGQPAPADENRPRAFFQYFSDLQKHEVIHREFFKMSLGANAIAGLTPNFGKIMFNDPVPPLAVVGMVLIVGGVALVSLSGATGH